MLKLKSFGAAAAIVAACLISTSASNATVLYSGPFYLSLDVNSTDTFSNVVIFTSNPPQGEGTSEGRFSFGGGVFNDPFSEIGAYYDTSVLLLALNSTGDLALFSNSDLGGHDFSATFGYSESNLIADLTGPPTSAGNAELNNFASAEIGPYGFIVGSPFYITAFSTGTPDGLGTSDFIAATPLPSTWTMMLIGLAGLGFFAYRRQRHNVALSAA